MMATVKFEVQRGLGGQISPRELAAALRVLAEDVEKREAYLFPRELYCADGVTVVRIRKEQE